MSYSWEKCLTHGRTDNGDFMGPSVGEESKNFLVVLISSNKIFFVRYYD